MARYMGGWAASATVARGNARLGARRRAARSYETAMDASTLPAPALDAPAETDSLLSVVVPVRNEAENILPLVAEIAAALAGIAHEIVYVDDGSTDATPERLAEAARRFGLRRRRHRASCGQSAAIVTGVRAARGCWIATLDGDGQNDPADIPTLFLRAQAEAARDQGPVLVTGHRVRRRDSRIKRLSSRVANKVRAAMLRDATPDTGCGLKVFRRELFMALPHFDHMHRFLPALVLRAGGRTWPVPVGHRPRTRGRSNYGTLDRLGVGIVDLFGVWWLQRRSRVPTIDPLSGDPP